MKTKSWLLLALPLSLAACSSSSPQAVPSTSQSATSTTNATTTTAPATVGTELTWNDGFSVQLVKIYDPGTPASTYTSIPPGSRIVAARFKLTNETSAQVSGDALVGGGAIGNNGQTYSTTFGDEIVGCTSFNSGSYVLPVGASEVGCVEYEVPNAVKISAIQFQPPSFSDQTATWKVGLEALSTRQRT